MRRPFYIRHTAHFFASHDQYSTLGESHMTNIEQLGSHMTNMNTYGVT